MAASVWPHHRASRRPASSTVWPSCWTEEGATTLRCPLIAIKDAPDQRPVEAWLRALAAGGMDDLIFLTGEGLRRLLAAAERIGICAPTSIAALIARAHDHPRAEAGARAEGDRPFVRPARGGADVGRRDRRAARDRSARPARRRPALRRGAEPAARRLPRRRRRPGADGRAVRLRVGERRRRGRRADRGAGGRRASTRSRSPARRRSTACGRWRPTPGRRRGCATGWRASASPPSARSSTRRWPRAACASTSMPEKAFVMRRLVDALAAALGPRA